jgi:hypothetical protein
MAKFEIKKIDINSINGGNQYEIGQSPTVDTFNKPIEASAYAQEVADRAISKADIALQKVNDSEIGEVTLSAYPIGSIYMSTNSTSPAELFGGTWEKIEDRFLLGSGTRAVGAKGGKERYHFIAAIGAYNDTVNALTYAATIAPTLKTSLYPYGLKTTADNTAKSKINHGTMVVEEDTSNDQYTTIMPPYEVVNIWKRLDDRETL